MKLKLTIMKKKLTEELKITPLFCLSNCSFKRSDSIYNSLQNIHFHNERLIPANKEKTDASILRKNKI